MENFSKNPTSITKQNQKKNYKKKTKQNTFLSQKEQNHMIKRK